MKRNPRPKLLFVGALTEDRIFRVRGFSRGPGKFPAEEVSQSAAGMATSAATAAMRLGGEVSLWASVGDDGIGSVLVRQIEHEGVNCSDVRIVTGGRTACAMIAVDEIGERWVITDYDPRTQRDPSGMPESWKTTAYAGVMADVRWPGASELALKAARRAGALALLDADVAPRETLERLAPHATHILASRPGASLLCGSKMGACETVRALAHRYETFVCVTDGAAGTFWLEHADSDVQHVPAPKVDVVDTLAAGDVYHGALALALAERLAPKQAIRFASAAAALKCTRFGGRFGAPERAETLTLVEETYDGSIDTR